MPTPDHIAADPGSRINLNQITAPPLTHR